MFGGQRQALAALPHGKELRYPLKRRLYGPQGQSVGFREEKVSCPDRLLKSGQFGP
jgi:hypothetical protein